MCVNMWMLPLAALHILAFPLVESVEFHVDSTLGSDSTGDGSVERPFVSLQAAQRAVRAELRAADEDKRTDITVSMAPGAHALAEPLRFDSRDSGRAGRRVVWRGTHGGDRTRILGGPAVGGWEHAWGSVYRSKLGRRVFALSEGGRQANLARHPNTNPGSGSGWHAGAVSNAGFTWAAGAKNAFF